MSEQTPDSNAAFDGDGMSGFSEENEPSMEDILASIRKIISEDADPVPLDVPAAPTLSSESASPAQSATKEDAFTIPVQAKPESVEQPSISRENIASSQPIGDGPLQSISPAMASDTDNFDIDALLRDIDLVEPEMPPMGGGDGHGGFEADDTIELEIPEIPDEVSVLIDGDAGVTEGAVSEELSASATDDKVLGVGTDEPDDVFFDRILGLYDEQSEGADTPSANADASPELSHPLDEAEAPRSDAKPDRPSFDDTDDLDLVKSLMADLTDGGTGDSDDNAVDVTATSDDDDILDDILNMAMDDEVALGPPMEADPLAEIADFGVSVEADATDPAGDDPAELQVQAEDIDTDFDDLLLTAALASDIDDDASDSMEVSSPPSSTESSSTEATSLTAIAAAAEADAQAAQSRLSSLARRTKPEAEAPDRRPESHTSGGPESESSDIVSSVEIETPAQPVAAHPVEAKIAASAQPLDESPARAADKITPAVQAPKTPEMPQKETPMPSAVRQDVILDDVTEEASMSAFAELNNLVEEKTILEERGPRIGDLVQEALKPMLKEWLEDNLQAIVERAVAKEVKRIASGK